MRAMYDSTKECRIKCNTDQECFDQCAENLFKKMEERSLAYSDEVNQCMKECAHLKRHHRFD